MRKENLWVCLKRPHKQCSPPSEEGLWKVVRPEWERAILRAEKLAVDQVPRRGVRSMDVLHIAFAIEAGASDFLSFDENQRGTAKGEGLRVGP